MAKQVMKFAELSPNSEACDMQYEQVIIHFCEINVEKIICFELIGPAG